MSSGPCTEDSQPLELSALDSNSSRLGGGESAFNEQDEGPQQNDREATSNGKHCTCACFGSNIYGIAGCRSTCIERHLDSDM